MKPNVVYLEKYTPAAKWIITDAQTLADKMRHEKVTIAHLCIIVNSFIDVDNILQKINVKNKPYISPKYAEKFKVLYNKTFEVAYLSYIKPSAKPDSAYLSLELLRLMSFAEDNAKVNVAIIMNELLLILNTRYKK